MATPLVALSVQPCHHHSKQYSFKSQSQSRVNRDFRTKTLLGVYNGFQNVYNQSYFHKPWAPIRVLEPNSRFLQMGPQETCSSREISKKSMSSEGSTSTSSSSISQQVIGILHLLVSLGIILAMDKLLKKAFVAAAIKFPSALFGMFCIFSVLVILDITIPAAATSLMNFFEPALLFIQRWLPLFYVPSLVVLPLSVKDIPAASGVKICFITAGGWLASLCVAGFTAIAVRKMVKTEMTDAEPMAKPSPFSPLEMWAWSGVFLVSFVVALLYRTALGTAARTCLPFLLASTVLGYMIGSGLPSGVKKVFHPIICCALSADLAALAFGYLSQSGLDPVLGYYLTKVSSNPGAGDVLMGFLGPVILSFAFSMFKQRKLVKRHAAEIFTSVIVSTLFSLYSTALVGRLVGLEPTLTVSIIPRCITVALALSIVSFFEGANSSLTAAVVVVTGLIGANFVQAVLDKLSFRDPIARGIATASSAHGLGTAALSAKEPEALPFCAIAYALTEGGQLAQKHKLNVKGELSILHLERVENPVDTKEATVAQKENLHHLTLNWRKYGESESQEHAEQVLESLEPHPNPKQLKMEGYKSIHFQHWICEPIIVDNLVSIELSDRDNCVRSSTTRDVTFLKGI